jgi:sugar/nucleoside kinase (ribokinase family)
VIGHICADILPNGSTVLGGTALYSALTAAALGQRVGVLTRGRFGVRAGGYDIPSLDQYAERLSIVVQEAEWPTCFVNEYSPSGRRTQTVPRWAGPIDLRGLPAHWRNARIVHLGPIAQEIDVRQTGALTPSFLGVTPQGWMRDWPRATGGRVQPLHLRLPAELLSRIDGIVVNDEEFVYARDTVERVGKSGYGIVTLGVQGARMWFDGRRTPIDAPAYNLPVVDPTGAGDVFAAAFFAEVTNPRSTPEAALAFANAAAGLSLDAVGTTGIRSRKAVRRLVDGVTTAR